MGTEGRVGVVTGEGVVFTDQGEGLRGEVSIFDLYSSVTSWGRAKSAPLRPLRSRNAFWSVLLLFGEQERWAQSEHNFECVYVCVCVCVCEHMCVHLRITWPKNKMHVKKKKKIKKIRKATAAKYTQKRDLFWWYLQSLCEKERKGKSPAWWGRGDLQTSVIIFIKISLCLHSRQPFRSAHRYIHPPLCSAQSVFASPAGAVYGEHGVMEGRRQKAS